VLHGGIVRISSSRQHRAFFSTPSGSQQGQAVLTLVITRQGIAIARIVAEPACLCDGFDLQELF
jgi:hypothetical protein